MSRYYEMSMEVTKAEGEITAAEVETLSRVFAEEWDEEACEPYVTNGHATFFAESSLCGGESEEEAHKRIVRAVKAHLPDVSVTTRWTYLEELPYNEYTD